MPKGIIGESGSDRATDKMDKFMSRSQGSTHRELTLLEQFQKSYPETWKEEIKKAKAEYENRKKNS
jgi:hypothetical protein